MSDETVELEVRTHCDRGDLAGSAEAAIRGYGPELLGFLTALRGLSEADDVFSSWSLRVWQALADFRWQCSFRTWAYTLPRTAALDAQKKVRRRERREVALGDDSALVRV